MHHWKKTLLTPEPWIYSSTSFVVLLITCRPPDFCVGHAAGLKHILSWWISGDCKMAAMLFLHAPTPCCIPVPTSLTLGLAVWPALDDGTSANMPKHEPSQKGQGWDLLMALQTRYWPEPTFTLQCWRVCRCVSPCMGPSRPLVCALDQAGTSSSGPCTDSLWLLWKFTCLLFSGYFWHFSVILVSCRISFMYPCVFFFFFFLLGVLELLTSVVYCLSSVFENVQTFYLQILILTLSFWLREMF